MSKENDAMLYPLAAIGLTKGLYEVYVRPELSAKRAWLAIGASVMAYELACPNGELLSEGADRSLNEHPLLTRAAIGLTALHLMNALPEKLDPFTQFIKFIKPQH